MVVSWPAKFIVASKVVVQQATHEWCGDYAAALVATQEWGGANIVAP